MTEKGCKFIPLEKGYQVLFNGESVGTIHNHKTHWTGTIGGNINFSSTRLEKIVNEMINFLEEWRANSGLLTH